MSITARAATAGEITKFRSPQASRLFAIFDIPATVFTCRVNQSFVTHDMVAQLAYDGASGSYADVAYGMTIYVGTSAGGWDVGITYARKAATSGILYIGECSEIAWADNLYITVVDDFGIWADHLRIQADGTALMRYDVAYSNQHSAFDPIPVIGGDQVKRLSGASVTFAFDASDSYVPGSTVTGRAWSFPGAASTTGTTTATPTATYDTPGRYRVIYTATAANGKTRTTYRNVYVYNDTHLISNVISNSASWDWESGGLDFDLTCYFDINTTQAHDRTKVILFEEAWYQDSNPYPSGNPASIGPLAGCENIVATGWLDDETIEIDWMRGEVSLTARSANFWLSKVPAFILGIENVGTTPTAWTQIQGLTVDKMLWHFFAWRSTVLNCCDVILTGDTRIASALESPQGNLWQQITTIADETILARPCSDPYGRIFVQIDLALVPYASRSGVPVVATLSADDYESIQATRVTVPKMARMELSGVHVQDANTTGEALFSLAPGHIFKHHGDIAQKEQLLLSDQTQANQLAADMVAKENAPYKFEIRGAANNRLVGVCPYQFLALDISATSNLRGIEYSGNVIVRRVEWELDPERGSIVSNWYADAETTSALMVNGDIPSNDSDDTSWSPPPFPAFPPLPPLPVPAVSTTGQPRNVVILAHGYGVFYTTTFDQASPTWIDMNAGFVPADRAALFQLTANRNGKICVSRWDNIGKIWAADFGSQFQEFAGADYFSLRYPPGWLVHAIALHPNRPDTLIAVVGMNYPASFTDVHYGTLSGGIDDVHRLSTYVEASGTISYGLGKWLLTYPNGIGFTNTIVRLTDNGVTEEYTHQYSNIGAQGSYHARAAMQYDKVFWYGDQSYLTSGGSVRNLSAYVIDSIAIDQTGLKMLASHTGNSPKYSTDGGANWSAITFPKGGTPRSKILCLDSDRWIWASGTLASTGDAGIWYTPDFGATFQDKTGNLYSLVGPDFYLDGLQVIS